MKVHDQEMKDNDWEIKLHPKEIIGRDWLMIVWFEAG